MKATTDFDDALYRRLKVEAARRGRTVRELVAEGVRHVLDTPATQDSGVDGGLSPESWRPGWLGALARYGRAVDDHSATAVRASVARGRAGERRR